MGSYQIRTESRNNWRIVSTVYSGKELITFVVGAFFAVIAERLIWPILRRTLISPVISWQRRRRDRRLEDRLDGSTIRINNHQQYLFEFAPRGFSPEKITGQVRSGDYDIIAARAASLVGTSFPDGQELQILYQQKQLLLNSPDVPFWNGSQLALQRVTRRRDPMIEDPILDLQFVNKDYANFLTIGELFEDLRESGALGDFVSRQIVQPDPLLATDFGLIINVVTADRKVIIARRSNEAYSWNGFWHIAVAESVTKQDADTGGHIDFFKVVGRALKEELGLSVDVETVARVTTFHALNIHISRHSWMLFVNVNFTDTSHTFESIRFQRSSGGGRDHWESNDLRVIEFNRKSVLSELTDRESEWIPFGLWCLLLSAVAERVLTLEELKEVASSLSLKTRSR